MKFHLPSSARSVALGAALAVAPAILGGQAHAAAIKGSDSIITFSVASVGGAGDLLSATSFAFGTTLWGQGSGDFSSIPTGQSMSSANLVISNLGGFSFTSAYGNFAAAPSIVIGGTTFTSAIVASSGSIASGSESLSIYLVGQFTPLGPLAGFDPNNASETISFTETGIAGGSFGSFSVSATFAAPASAPPVEPPTNTPEPASLALLGAGLVGLGAARRRKGDTA